MALLAATLIASVLVLSAESVGAQGDSTRVLVRAGASIQDAIDAADGPTTIIVRGDHVENIWINKSGITLLARGASISMPEEPFETPCVSNPGGGEGPPPTLICVFPMPSDVDGPPPLDTYLNDVTVTGFDLSNRIYDAVGVLFANNVRINRNTIAAPGCDGIFAIFVTGFSIEGNTVTRAGCNGIGVVGSSNGEIRRNVVNHNEFNGIALNETSGTLVIGNRAIGNCIGIGAADQPDDGFGGVFEGEVPSRDVHFFRNFASRNNRLCFPFGPDIPLGGTGLLVSGVDGARVFRNRASNNIAPEPTFTGGGIFVGDFPNQDGSTFSFSQNVAIVGNKAIGNSAGGVDGDLVIPTEGAPIVVRANRCNVGVPNAGWCQAVR